jgi:hypothetical protein
LPRRHQAAAAKLPPLPRHRQAAAAIKLCAATRHGSAAAKLSPPSCRRQAAAALALSAATALPPPPHRRQAAAAKLSPPSCHRATAKLPLFRGGGADLMAWNIFGRVENYKKLSCNGATPQKNLG